MNELLARTMTVLETSLALSSVKRQNRLQVILCDSEEMLMLSLDPRDEKSGEIGKRLHAIDEICAPVADRLEVVQHPFSMQHTTLGNAARAA